MEPDPATSLPLIFELAGLPLSEERRALMAGALPLARAATAALAAPNYGEIEPASRFRPDGRASARAPSPSERGGTD